MKKVIITLLCIFFMCTIVVCADFERECETVPVIIKDVIVEPATVLKGFYLPEKYYLALEYNDKYIWTIPGKEAYEKYKDKVGETIEADIEVRSGFLRIIVQIGRSDYTGYTKGRNI